ncbi:unnamed protein product, partial [Lampetra fluviatilis]
MNEPAYLLVGTDVSAKYRGAFCEAKIKSVKKLVKVKVLFKQDSSSHVVQDDQIKGCLRIGAAVEIRMSDGTLQEGMISKLTDASWYTVVFDDGDETVLRRSSLRLKGERHFAKSESLDQLPLTHPEHFGTPVLGRKSVKGRRSGLTAGEEKEVAEWSEEDEAERVVADDGTVGHVVCVEGSADDKRKGYPLFPALVVSPDCNDEVTVRRDQCLVRSFKDGTFHCVARKDIRVMDRESFPKPEAALKQAFEDALGFLEGKESPASWKKDLSSVHQDDSGSEIGGDEQTVEHEEEEEAEDEESDPEERDNFLQQLYQFMENRGTPINRPPVLCYRRLNLFKLYRLVQKRGGSTGIKSGTTWKQVYKELGVPVLNSAASHNIKSTYRKYLFGFEEYCRSVRIRFRSVEYAMEAEGRQVGRRTGRRREAPAPQPDPEEPSAADEAPMSDKREATTTTTTRRRTKASPAAVASEEECSDEGTEKKEEEEEMMDDGNAAAVEEGSEKKEEESGIKEEPDGQTVAAVVAAAAPVEEMEEKLVEVEENDERMETRDSDGADDLEGYPLGTRLQVKYGRGKTLKVYEASIRKRGVEAGEIIYLVHYFGWNSRYDEWIRADRIIRPIDKNVPKIKHKKKIKHKHDKEEEKGGEKQEEKALTPARRGRPPLHAANRVPGSGVTRTPSRTLGSGGRGSARSTRSTPTWDSPSDTSEESETQEEKVPEKVQEKVEEESDVRALDIDDAPDAPSLTEDEKSLALIETSAQVVSAKGQEETESEVAAAKCEKEEDLESKLLCREEFSDILDDKRDSEDERAPCKEEAVQKKTPKEERRGKRKTDQSTVAKNPVKKPRGAILDDEKVNRNSIPSEDAKMPLLEEERENDSPLEVVGDEKDSVDEPRADDKVTTEVDTPGVMVTESASTSAHEPEAQIEDAVDVKESGDGVSESTGTRKADEPLTAAQDETSAPSSACADEQEQTTDEDSKNSSGGTEPESRSDAAESEKEDSSPTNGQEAGKQNWEVRDDSGFTSAEAETSPPADASAATPAVAPAVVPAVAVSTAPSPVASPAAVVVVAATETAGRPREASPPPPPARETTTTTTMGTSISHFSRTGGDERRGEDLVPAGAPAGDPHVLPVPQDRGGHHRPETQEAPQEGARGGAGSRKRKSSVHLHLSRDGKMQAGGDDHQQQQRLRQHWLMQPQADVLIKVHGCRTSGSGSAGFGQQQQPPPPPPTSSTSSSSSPRPNCSPEVTACSNLTATTTTTSTTTSTGTLNSFAQPTMEDDDDPSSTHSQQHAASTRPQGAGSEAESGGPLLIISPPAWRGSSLRNGDQGSPTPDVASQVSLHGTDPSALTPTSATASAGATGPLHCALCQERLEDTHFVQCPSVAAHRFCFPCSRGSIRSQGACGEVYCPSGERCPLLGSSVPWAFMQGEIATILAGD